jgi:hypothetical protein
MKHSETIIEAVAPRTRTAVGFQSALAVLLFAVVAAVALGVDFLARNAAVARWFNERGMREAIQSHANFDERGPFYDEIDSLWLVKLEQADYSKGGVEIFGSSVAHSALRDWSYPRDQRAVIHNYGYNGANMANCADFVRYLIKYRGMLEAGPRKTLIVLGLHYLDIGNSLDTKRYFDASVLRSGVYEYDSLNGIRPTPLNPLERMIKLEEMRCRSFLLGTVNSLGARDSKLNPKMFRRMLTDRLGPNWKALLASQASAEAQLLDDLKARGVNVIGILLPRGSWTEGTPADAFSDEMRRIYAQRQIPLLDYSRSVPDSEYMDLVHYSFQGEEITDQFLMKLALDFLHGTEALPAGSVFKETSIPGMQASK